MQAGDVPARLACMPVMDSMIEFGGNSSIHHNPFENSTQKPRHPPRPRLRRRGEQRRLRQKGSGSSPALGVGLVGRWV